MSAELDRLAAACLFPGFAGVAVPEWLRPWLEGGLGGVVLFARNVEDREQLAALTGDLRARRADLLVGLDEEGGDVTRLEAVAGSSYPGNLALGVVDDVALTEEVAAAIAGDLAAVGVNVDLAPVADVNSNPDNPIVGVRSFGREPELVARHVAAFVAGVQRAGVAACAKHFPGHGDTVADSHLELPVVGADRETLLARELPPFRAAIDAGVRAIMTAHVSVPALAAGPATLRPELLHVLLRTELGFQGLVITDALEMRAVSGTIGLEEGAVQALAAGADALCLGADLAPEEVAGIHRAIVNEVRSGRLAEERLREAAGRVARAAQWSARAAADAPTRREVGLEAARRAVASDGEDALSRAPLVVDLRPEPSIAAGEARHGLVDSLRPRVPAKEVVRLREAPAAAGDLLDGHGDRQLVVVVRDAHRHAWERATAEALIAAAPDAIVVEIGLPVWRPARAAGFIATYGGGRANLEAAAERLAGRRLVLGLGEETRREA